MRKIRELLNEYVHPDYMVTIGEVVACILCLLLAVVIVPDLAAWYWGRP